MLHNKNRSFILKGISFHLCELFVSFYTQNLVNCNRFSFSADKQVPQSLPAIANIAYRGSSRVQDLEGRIKVSEQSNKLLLEELMKLQQDLKLALRQNEEMVMKERQERIAIRDKVEAAENMYNRVAMQLLRTEEKVKMEHSTLATLLNQSKEVERALAGGQQRSMMKGEQIDRFISRFRDDLSELRQANEQIQSSLRLVGEDVKNIQHRFEMQNAEFDSVNQEIKQKVKKIETDSMATVSWSVLFPLFYFVCFLIYRNYTKLVKEFLFTILTVYQPQKFTELIFRNVQSYRNFQ